MSEPFIGEVKIWAGNFAPKGYSFCDGKFLQVAQAYSLFSIVGTTYGGDGRQYFGLPNLQGRAPMGAGDGSGLTPRSLGQAGGVEQGNLSEAQMANHNHGLVATNAPADQDSPANNTFGRSRDFDLYGFSANTGTLDPSAVESAGGGQPHSNVQPYLFLCFVIALTGVMPKRPE